MAMRHVIVGAGPAGQAAIETLRALDPDAKIDLVCDEPAYARMVLPYYLIGNIEESGVMTGDEAWFREIGVTPHFGRRVTGLRPGEHRLSLDDGSSLDYDKLLLATGSRVATPSIDGSTGQGIVPMWTLEHAREFLGAPHAETVVVGAGFIAFTILDAIAERSDRLELVEIEDQILPRMIDAQGAAIVEQRLADRGIRVRTGARLERIAQADGRRRLSLEGGGSLDCDAVILATGILANVDFLEGSEIRVDSGIVVDERMQTNVADVYAAGDVAAGPDLQGGPRGVRAIQPVAVDHGRVAAANMAGEDVRYLGALTMNILAVQGLEACSFGRWEENDDTTVVGGAPIYRKYVWNDDVLVGGILVGPSLAVSAVNDVGMLKGLVQSGISLGPWRGYLDENPLDLRRAYVASGVARTLLDSTLLAGRASAGGGFRFPARPARRPRSPHHAVLTTGAP